MAYTPTRFYMGNGGNTNGNNTLYTVPAGKTAIITDIQYGFSGTAGQGDLILQANLTNLSYAAPSSGGAAGTFLAGEAYQWSGMYILNASETISNTTSYPGSHYLVISGLLGSGQIDGKTPTRFAYFNVSTAGPQTVFTASGGGAIISTIFLLNKDHLSSTAYGLRIGSVPIEPWGGAAVLAPRAFKQLDVNYFIPSGTAVTVDNWYGSPQHGITGSLYGWQL